MPQSISQYLVDWPLFCRMWEEEENPQDALEGAIRLNARDPYFSGSVWFGSIWSAHRRRSPEPDVLESVISAFRANIRSPYRDLPDDFAYEEGGFSVVMSPETVKHLVEMWRSVNAEALEERLVATAGPDQGTMFRAYLEERMKGLEQALAAGRGYVTQIG